MVREVTKYYAEDGTEFTSWAAADALEKSLASKLEERYRSFINHSYYGRDLMSKHTLDEQGIWQVLGEDPNCDFGGYHHMPELGFFEGTLEQVIRKAVSMDNFYTWGGGGKIVKQVPPKVIKL